ncbi:hypothetical protein PTI98_005051 [Pleurotus ostreatus]|nr:hypothetical protein PTI98_005051 [Pleurotus ostreatus]
MTHDDRETSSGWIGEKEEEGQWMADGGFDGGAWVVQNIEGEAEAGVWRRGEGRVGTRRDLRNNGKKHPARRAYAIAIYVLQSDA